VPSEWTTPVVTWQRVQCSDGGVGTFSYVEGVSYTSEYTHEVSTSIATTIETGFFFAEASFTFEMSYSYSHMLSYTSDTSVSHTFECT